MTVVPRAKKSLILLISLFFIFLSAKNTVYSLGRKSKPEQAQPLTEIAAVLGETWQPGLLLAAFIDVGQGDAIVFITPEKKIILIDAGETRQRSIKNPSQTIADFLRFYDIRKIDYLILTHPHSDHIGGAADIINSFEIGEIIDSGYKGTSRLYMQLLQLIKIKKIKYTIPKPNDTLDIGGSIKAEILHSSISTPAKNLTPNNASIVLKIIFNKISFLMTGDIEAPIENKLLNEYDLSASVLKVPHHGSSTSSAIGFINTVNPAFAVITVGRNNRYNLPTPNTLKKFKERPEINLFRTDQHGTIEMLTNGYEIKIKLQLPVNKEKLYDFFRY